MLILDTLDVISATKTYALVHSATSDAATVQQEMTKIKNIRMYYPWSSLEIKSITRNLKIKKLITKSRLQEIKF